MAQGGPSSSGGAARREREVPVELGFLEEDDETQKYKLKSAFFPSKFGGLPAWLDLKNVPGLQDVKCSLCDKPAKFLLQVYAPMDTEESFHRTIFIFVCPSKVCCVERNSNKNLVVMRCQIKQSNEFYSSEAPDEKDKSLGDVGPWKFGVNLCRVCGVKSTQSCGKCEVVYYCGKDHQTLDWKEHGKSCEKKDELNSRPVETYCYKEHALVIDTEVLPKPSKKDKKSEKEKLQEYEQLVSEGRAGDLDDAPPTRDMLEAASLKSDKAFNKFKKRVAYQPDQVLRYDRGGTPLWVSNEKTMESGNVAPCPYCKGSRVFEFQIMPQLLNYVGDDSVIGDLDWGTLAVYTCEKHCASEGPSYKKEFIWQQDFKPDEKDKD